MPLLAHLVLSTDTTSKSLINITIWTPLYVYMDVIKYYDPHFLEQDK